MSIDPAMLGDRFDCVFDVGAHVGAFSRACLEEWAGVTVDSFEPLRDLINLPQGGPWRWHQTALAEISGRAVMWRNEFEPSSSLLPMEEAHREAFPYTRAADTVVVNVGRLDEYADRIHGRALLKIDVQGAELRVLEGAGAALARFSAVVLEVSHVPLYHGAATPDQLAAFLRSRRFEHRARVAVTRHPVTGQMLQTDELWTEVR